MMARIGSTSWLRRSGFMCSWSGMLHTMYFILALLSITFVFMIVYSSYQTFVIDLKTNEILLKSKIVDKMLKPSIDAYTYMGDDKVLTSRKILKHPKRYDDFTLSALGFELDSCKVWSKQKTSMELRLEDVKTIQSHWCDDKWWYAHKDEYMHYLTDSI